MDTEQQEERDALAVEVALPGAELVSTGEMPGSLETFLDRLAERNYAGALYSLDPGFVRHVDLSILSATEDDLLAVAQQCLRFSGRTKVAGLLKCQPLTTKEIKAFKDKINAPFARPRMRAISK